MPRKNILVITVDDLNAWSTADSMYGGTVYTPNIDRLMSQGTTFVNAHAQTALCNPSRASVWSGNVPSDTAIHNNLPVWFHYLTPEHTLHGLMKSAGYEVVGVGKVYHTEWQPPNISRLMFDSYSSAPHDAGSVPYQGPIEDLHDFKITQTAINFLDSYDARSGRPFFLTVGITRPHHPNAVPNSFFDLYPLDSIKLPPYRANDLSDVPASIGDCAFAERLPSALPEHEWKQQLQGYLAGTSFADAMIGRVINALKDNGLESNTSVVVFGDNGFQMGEKNYFDKFTLWDPSTRVPLIIADPTLGHPGRVIEHAVEALDLFPTVLQLAGVPVPAFADGRSLVPLLSNPAMTWDGEAFSSVYGSFSVRTDDWRYTRYFDGQEELYDMDADPHEWVNLAGQDRYALIKAALAARLEAYFHEHHILSAKPSDPSLTGTAADETLINANSNVTLAGGAGDDVYIAARGTTPTVIEGIGAGLDTIVLDGTVFKTMPANIERAYFREMQGAIEFSGNASGNLISGRIKGADDVRGGAGDDTILGIGDNDTISGEAGRDQLQGGTQDDRMHGGNGDDSLLGESSRDILIGGSGNDLLNGGADGDRLTGGAGTDRLAGGDGQDVFVYAAVTDAPVGSARDVILGFDGVGAAAGDKIDLAPIDANALLAGDQSYAFIGTAAFTKAGQLRVVEVGGNTVIQGNTDGDLAPEMEIQVNDGASSAAGWRAADFLL